MMNEAKLRTYGRLAEGSTVARVEEDTHSDVEYGERTWTTGQTVRDILQNHLDAQTERFYEELLSAIVDTRSLAEGDEDQQKQLEEFGYLVFRYRKGFSDFSKDTKAEMQRILEQSSRSLPLKEGYRQSGSGLNFNVLDQAISSIAEVPPKLLYKIKDLLNPGNKDVLVSLEELKQAQFTEMLVSGSPDSTQSEDASASRFRYEIEGLQITDQGSGFDTKLTAFYLSTKSGKKHLRGKFGEGGKMSEIHLVRNGARVKMRSSYAVESSGEGGAEAVQKRRIWQTKPYVTQGGTVRLRGVQVEAEAGEETGGSNTIVDISRSDARFQEDFRYNTDPRLENGGLGLNCLEYSPVSYHYPSEVPVGLSTDVDSKYQYVQGLRVGEEEYKNTLADSRLFSYDFLDSSLIRGRDRKHLRQECNGYIKNFWRAVDHPDLLEALLKKAYMEKDYLGGTSEEEGLAGLLTVPSDELSDRDLNARAIVLNMLPSVLGLKFGERNVVVSKRESVWEKDQALLRRLREKGYHIVNVEHCPSYSVIKSLNLLYEGRMEMQSYDEIKENPNVILGTFDRERESSQRTEKIFKVAYEELLRLLIHAGGAQGFNTVETPVLLETIDPYNDLPVELAFDKTVNKFVVQLRPELITKYPVDDLDHYWKNRIQVELLASLDRAADFKDRNSLLIHAQSRADDLLLRTLSPEAPDVAAMPENFNHQVSEDTRVTSFMERLMNTEAAKHSWDLWEKASSMEVSLSEIDNILAQWATIREPYREEIGALLKWRVISEDGELGFLVNDPEDGQVPDWRRVKVSELQPVAEVKGKGIYQIGNKLVVLTDIPDNAIVRVGGDTTYVRLGDQTLAFSEYGFGKYDYVPRPLGFDQGVLTHTYGLFGMDLKQRNITDFMLKFEEVSIEYPERPKSVDMDFLSGTVETPLPKEYGIHEWNNPVRIFQDIIQNHIDASPTGEIEIRYEVRRENSRIWITESEFTGSDQIIGLEVTDNGSGYVPNDIGTMGKSSKRSPLFAGKYGEGQKLLAAAAARNALDLTFSSVGTHKGKSYRWSAAVDTKPEEVTIRGKGKVAERVVFDVASEEETNPAHYISKTVIRLPDTVSLEGNAMWQSCETAIDPRQRDEKGNRGLARYVRNLRRTRPEDIIDMGCMKILLNEPGAVYENGLLISNDQDQLLFGYDVPDIVDARERNHYDSDKLNRYISFIMKECPDHRLAIATMKAFRQRYLGALIENPSTNIKEQELQFKSGSGLGRGSNLVPARPNWDVAFAREVGSYVIHSNQALIEEAGNLQKNLQHLSDASARATEARLADILNAAMNIGHLPPERVIHLSAYDYVRMKQFFPTAVSFLETLSTVEVPISSQTLEDLQRVVSGSATEIGKAMELLLKNEDTSLTLGRMLSSLPTGSFEDKVAEMWQRVGFWSDLETLKDNPHSIFLAQVGTAFEGKAEASRIGINEELLAGRSPGRLAETIRHELVHSITGLSDYTPEFIMTLLELAKNNIAA